MNLKITKILFVFWLMTIECESIYAYPIPEDLSNFSLLDILFGIPFFILLYACCFIVVFIVTYIRFLKIGAFKNVFAKVYSISKKITKSVIPFSWIIFLVSFFIFSFLWGIVAFMILGINRIDIFLSITLVLFVLSIVWSTIHEICQDDYKNDFRQHV
jgi:hypothetical protein